MKKILVLTSGGDAPGMNAAIRAVVRMGYSLGMDVYGCLSGFQGLVEQRVIRLDPDKVANIIQLGGTILKTDRCLAFYEAETRHQCRAFLQRENISGLIVIGGNGSFCGASLFSAEGGPAVIGIPSTIDNDILGTDYTIGFDTARNTALEAIDRIRDTASSLDRNFLVEVMGRDSGFLAVDVGLAGGAEFILIPELDIPIEKLAAKILAPRRQKRSSIIVVAEASQPGRSIRLASQLEELTKIVYRVCILGHTQRGGTPTLLDRKIASEMGALAVKALADGFSHKMVALNQNQLALHSFPATAHPRLFTETNLLALNSILCA